MGVVIIASDEGLGGVVPLGRAARQSGDVPVLLSTRVEPSLLRAWEEIYDQVCIIEEPYDSGALAAAARECARGERISGLFSCYDGLVIPAARAARSLGLPHPALGGLERSRNKYAGRLTTRACGLRTPRFSLVTSEADCAAAADEVGFPAILKPVNGLASHLVRRVESLAGLCEAYRESVARILFSFRGNYSYPLGNGEGGADFLDPRTSFLLEQFIEGVEYSAEVLVRDGQVHRVALFHKLLVDPVTYYEPVFTSPGFFKDPEREEAIWKHIESALRSHGVDNTSCHVEIIDAGDGPYLVEINAGRPGGQLMVRASREATGIDLIAETLALHCGRDRPAARAPSVRGRISTFTVFPQQSGRLKQIEGLDEAARLAGVVDVVPFCKPGDVLDVRDKEIFALNFLVVGVEDREALVNLYRALTKTVRFVMAPVDEG